MKRSFTHMTLLALYVVLTFESEDKLKSRGVTIQTNSFQQYFHIILFFHMVLFVL